VVKDFSWVGQSPFAIRFSREWRIANSVPGEIFDH